MLWLALTGEALPLALLVVAFLDFVALPDEEEEAAAAFAGLGSGLACDLALGVALALALLALVLPSGVFKASSSASSSSLISGKLSMSDPRSVNKSVFVSESSTLAAWIAFPFCLSDFALGVALLPRLCLERRLYIGVWVGLPRFPLGVVGVEVASPEPAPSFLIFLRRSWTARGVQTFPICSATAAKSMVIEWIAIIAIISFWSASAR